jgi:CRISPR-associated Csx14 family protein
MRMPNPRTSHPVLIATLGTEPQVVTAAFDLLIQQGESIRQVEVVHTTAPGTAIALSVETLRCTFEEPPYVGNVSLNLHALTDAQDRPLPDIETPEEIKTAFRLLYQLVRDAKQTGMRVHLSIAGGRKSLAVFGMTVGQMLFDDDDRLWHLYSSGDFLASKRLHPESNDDVHLISIPVILWSSISPILAGLGQFDDPSQAIEHIRRIQLNEKLEQARSFVLGVLTPSEERVVYLLVSDGSSDNDIAAQLNLSPRTVEQHLRSAYTKAAFHWELEDVGRVQLVGLLNLYYTLIKGIKLH